MPKPLKNFFSRLISPIIDSTIREHLTIAETDNTFFIGTRRYDETDRDRLEYDRYQILEQCLEAWRDNPLARRIVELTSQYVIGTGFDIKCKSTSPDAPKEHQDPTSSFITKFWHHRLNRMPSRITELCDELTRTGNLFVLISTDPSGMSYIRTIPATNIDLIQSLPNDIEQPAYFTTKADENLESITYQAYNHNTDAQSSDGSFTTVVLHYAINRPSGAQWGESDLSPLLPWLRRYSAWLEDRVRLNRFRNAFLYVVSGSFASEQARKTRQSQLAANPPSPGSILVTDQSETWSVISPKLEALDAMNDGLALKKLIASGVGIPLHFLAEPEGSNRTTAESAGGPTFRRFEQRQEFFKWLLSDLLHVVISRRALVDHLVNPESNIEVSGADISARDNVSHSIASVNILNTVERLKDMGLISDREVLRIVYRFAGESGDLDDILAGGSGVDNRASADPITPASKEPVNPTTGSPKKSVLP